MRLSGRAVAAPVSLAIPTLQRSTVRLLLALTPSRQGAAGSGIAQRRAALRLERARRSRNAARQAQADTTAFGLRVLEEILARAARYLPNVTVAAGRRLQDGKVIG